MRLKFQSVQEFEAGARWQALFERHWPSYHAWFMSEGDAARPTYLASLRALKAHMPELLSTYEHLCVLAGGGDLAARFLAHYRPPPYLSGCSQAVWHGDEPLLVRNYDYSPTLCEGLVLHSRWNGRRVIGMVDCLWGAVDGMNDAGLAVSLTFGGRQVVGDGFGVPLILRYVLEFCETTDEAVRVLERVPVHMAYNVTVLDRSGAFRTAFLSPDRRAVLRQFPLATNHQGRVEWRRHAWATATLERERFLFERYSDTQETQESFVGAFLKPPLYSEAYARGFGTLYTAVYRPQQGRVDYLWPDATWALGFERFEEFDRNADFERPARRPSVV